MKLKTNDKRILFVTHSDRSTVTTSLVDLKPGDKVIVETLCTKSEATVVWQDGSIGKVIFLLKIHHYIRRFHIQLSKMNVAPLVDTARDIFLDLQI